MDQRDRLFAEIATRLELLTREQIATCARQAETTGKRIGEIAIELGYISHDEALLVLAQEARAMERARPGQRGAAPGAREERVQRNDPRSASSPAATQPKAAPPPAPPASRQAGAKRGPPRAWEAPEQLAQGQIHVPRKTDPPAREDTRPIPGGVRPLSVTPASPVPRVSVAPQRAPRRAEDVAPAARTPPTRAESFEVFPLASGPEAARLSVPAQAPAPASSQWGASATLIGAQAPLNVEAQRASVPNGTLIGASVQLLQPATIAGPDAAAVAAANAIGMGKTLVQQFAPAQAQVPAQAPAPAQVPAQVQTPAAAGPSAPPLKVAAQRPAATIAPADSYLGKALALALRQGASDLHAHSGAPILVRVDGQIRPLANNTTLSAEAAEKIIAEITTDAQWAQLGKAGEVDFACEIPGLARFRVNVYRQHRGIDAVFRIIPLRPPTLEELGLPARLSRLMDFRTGMVLCTGPAGCGKSTTLAALLGSLTQNRADHVLTIEDPVEFVLPPGKALVNQRQVIEHTSSFSRALRAALREDPDVIAITELRDRETISLAISAAETGHLVLGTLNTGSAGQTIHRIVSSFGADEQEQVRTMLAESLRAVVSQRLVPMANGKGRAPALELLMVNTAVSTLIRKDETHQIPSVLQTGRAAGMIMLDDSLDELVRAGTVTKEVARRFAVRKERFN
jgi:twitching motility protein PilT